MFFFRSGKRKFLRGKEGGFLEFKKRITLLLVVGF